jgi:DNA-binding transcriptional MerR regulator/DNA-directed RNA polymerase subunit RPC12/RpoP
MEVIPMQENTNTYTTGDVAKICHVSIRTVQFYDREQIVSPSALSEGGRRIYTESDVADFRLACLYKSLGLYLKEIKRIMDSEEKYAVMQEVLREQKVKVEKQIQALTASKEKIATLQEELDSHDGIRISSEEELNQVIFGKKKHRKTDVMTYFFLACYVLILIIGFPLATAIGGAYPYAMLGIAVILLVGLIYYHASVNAYICQNCHKKFTIGFVQDMVSPNGAKKGKYLRCPHCRKRAWMSETFMDE